MVNNNLIWIAILLLLPCLMVSAQQQITTAEDFLESVSSTYGEINDYTADLTITRDGAVSRGKLSFLSPNKVRIDFTIPSEQVLVSDGRDLWIYLPAQGIVLQQSARSSSSGLGLANKEGLTLLQTTTAFHFFHLLHQHQSAILENEGYI